MVRAARSGDAKALAHVHRQAWEQAYRSLIPPLQLEAMVSRRDAAWWKKSIRRKHKLLVLEVCQAVAGYATFGPARGPGSKRGEIYELYLEPAHQGLGLGEFLFEACRFEMEGRGLPKLIVWSLAENEPALTFYWNRGGRPFGRSRECICGVELDKIGFAWD